MALPANRTMARIMAGKEPSVKRYVVRLEAVERKLREAAIREGKGAAQMLPKADAPDAGESWSDSRNVEALETSAAVWHFASDDARIKLKTSCPAICGNPVAGEDSETVPVS